MATAPQLLIDAPFYSTDFSDCTLLIGPDELKFMGHRNILSIRSAFFRRAFQSEGFREAREKTIRLPEVQRGALTNILRWIYGAHLHCPDEMLTANQWNHLLKFYETADFLGVHALIEKLVDYFQRLLNIAEKSLNKMDVQNTYMLITCLGAFYSRGKVVSKESLKQIIWAYARENKITTFQKSMEMFEESELNGRLHRDISFILCDFVNFTTSRHKRKRPDNAAGSKK
ncbi:hypothetical protein TWF696_002647 [Orbilia brochopaga]|uniref:BTB domain-containing protein n=1 Tax=Orbilia brochopaga TaxID=3140254 RepID=A0AAV9U2R6_9PEZI